MRTRIFQISVREIEEPVWLNELYDAVQVGSGATFCPHRDSECEGSISQWNPLYYEQTGTFWVWKEGSKDLDIVGLCQYRRRLKFKDAAEVEKIFERFDCIVPEPLFLGSVYEQYARCHSRADMVLAEQIVKEKYPEFSDGFNAYIKRGNVLYYSASYVMRKKDFDDWCCFWFGFCDEFRRRRGWDTPGKAKADVQAEMDAGLRGKARGADYQGAVFGFLQERMLTMWVRTRFPRERIAEVPFVKFDGV